jgi:hypothetical protein
MSDQEMLSCEGDISPIFQSDSSSSIELNSIDNGNVESEESNFECFK